MAIFAIVNYNVRASLITPGDTVTIQFDLKGNIGTQVRLSYTLDRNNNVYFSKNGKRLKEIIRTFTLQAESTPINDILLIVKSGTPDFNQVFIDILALDTQTQNPASNNHTIRFK